MSDEVRDSYDAIAELYASLNLDALDHDTNAQEWLAVFAKLAAARHGVVADLGCGPGHVVHHLSELDLTGERSAAARQPSGRDEVQLARAKRTADTLDDAAKRSRHIDPTAGP